jgi:hypothetical protein
MLATFRQNERLELGMLSERERMILSVRRTNKVTKNMSASADGDSAKHSEDDSA